MIEIQTFDGTGSDCGGSNGDANRVLTLSNTGLTQQDGFLVYASGLALALTTEYTVSHNSTSTEITFLNRLWDDMTIVVNYWQQKATGIRGDVQGIISEHGITATLIRQTEDVATMGDVTDVTEASYTIYTMIQDITRKDRQIHEMGLAIPGNSKAFFYHEYPDSITGNGVVSPQVGDIIVDGDSKRWRIEKMIGERYANQTEVFRVAIIKKIDLDQ